MINVKQLEYGVIGVLLESQADLRDLQGTLTTQLDGLTSISTITLTLAQAPAANKAGLWLTGNAGDFQRFEYKGVTNNGNGTYTFTLDRLTEVRLTIAAASNAFVEKAKLPILPFGDLVESDDFTYIQVKADRNQQEFPGMKGDAAKYWNITGMVAVVNRIAQDKNRVRLTDIYAIVERAFVIEMTTAALETESGVVIHGFLQQESEDGKWDNERQGMICELEIKYNND